MKKKLLLTGASGFLGWNICASAKNDWEIFGVIHSKPISISGVEIIATDLTQIASVKNLFLQLKPDAVIHTAAISDANYCQNYPEESHKINVEASIMLVEESAKMNIPFVFTSTDLVFDGIKGNYKERDALNPVSKYGEQKAEAEHSILNIYPKAVVCRMPLMIGDSGIAAQNYLKQVLDKFKKKEKLTLFIDEYRSPLGGYSAAQGLLFALENYSGIYHLGGKERLSRYELGLKIVRAFGYAESLIIPVKQKEIKMAAPRPPDVSLNSSKAQGFKPLTIDEELLRLHKN